MQAGAVGACWHHVEDDVVGLALLREVACTVVDEPVGPHAQYEVFFHGAVDRSDSGAHGLGDLYRMDADTAAGAIDQYPVIRLNVGLAHEM